MLKARRFAKTTVFAAIQNPPTIDDHCTVNGGLNIEFVNHITNDVGVIDVIGDNTTVSGASALIGPKSPIDLTVPFHRNGAAGQ